MQKKFNAFVSEHFSKRQTFKSTFYIGLLNCLGSHEVHEGNRCSLRKTIECGESRTTLKNLLFSWKKKKRQKITLPQ